MNNFIATIHYHSYDLPISLFKFNDDKEGYTRCDLPYSNATVQILINLRQSYEVFTDNNNEKFIQTAFPIEEIEQITFFE